MDFNEAAPETVLDDCDFLLELAEEAAGEKYGFPVAQPRAPNPTALITPGAGYQVLSLGQVRAAPAGGLFGTQTSRPAVDQGGYIEKLSGLKVSRPVIGSLVVRERLNDGLFVKFSALKQNEEVPSSTWNTLVVLASKVQAQSQRGDSYSRWTVTDLSGTTATLFVFGDAHRDHYKESEGSVIILAHPKWKREEARGGGAPFSLSVERPEQMVRVGTSPDFGFCLGKRSDGTGCKQIVNRSACEYCVYHAPAALRKLTAAARPDLPGRSLFERSLRPVARKGEQMRAAQKALVAMPVMTGQQMRDVVARVTAGPGAGGSSGPGGEGGPGPSGVKRSRGADLVLASASAQEEEVVRAKRRKAAALARRTGRGAAQTLGGASDEDEGGAAAEPVSEAKARLMAVYKTQQHQQQQQQHGAAQAAAEKPRAVSAPPARPSAHATAAATPVCARAVAASRTPQARSSGLGASGTAARGGKTPASAAAVTASHGSEEDDDLEIEDAVLVAVMDGRMSQEGAASASSGKAGPSGTRPSGRSPLGGISHAGGEDGDLEFEDEGVAAATAVEVAAQQQPHSSQAAGPSTTCGVRPGSSSRAPGTGQGAPAATTTAPNRSRPTSTVQGKENSRPAQLQHRPGIGNPKGTSALGLQQQLQQKRAVQGSKGSAAPQSATDKLLADLGIRKPLRQSSQLQPTSQQDASQRKAQDMLASLGVVRGSRAGGLGQHAPGAPASAMAAAFGGLIASAPEAAQEVAGSRYSALAADASFDAVLKGMDALEKREALVSKMEATTKLQVTAFHCKECDFFAERKQPQCAQHSVTRVTAFKRWWRCNHCNGHFDTIGVIFPKKRCPRCNDPGQEFTPASMFRGPKGGMRVAGSEAGGSNLAERAAFQARGTEHAFSLRGGFV